MTINASIKQGDPYLLARTRTALLNSPGICCESMPGLEPSLDHHVKQNEHLANRNIYTHSLTHTNRLTVYIEQKKPRQDPASQRQSPAFHHAKAAKLTYTSARLPCQHRHHQRWSKRGANARKRTGSCPDSNRGPLATDFIKP